MSPRSALQGRLVSIAAGALVAGLVPFAFNSAVAQTRGATIGVHNGHYVFAGAAIDDLDVFESELRAAGEPAVRFDVCDGDVTRALLAAIHRFSHLPMSLRYVAPSAPSCTVTTVAMQVGLRSGPKPYGIDDAQVRQYWLAVSP